MAQWHELRRRAAERWALVQALHARGLLIRHLAGRLLVLSGLCQYLRIERQGFTLRFHPTALSLALWVDPDDRISEERFFTRFLRPGDTVVDVGANIGDLTLVAVQCVGPTGRVVAIEPHPRTFLFLQANLTENHAVGVQALNVALGSTEGEARLTDRRSDDTNAMSPTGTVPVAIRRLDDVVADTERIALLKIDVEGYERFVLDGALAALEHTECVYFECSEEAFTRFGYRTADLMALLHRAGFTVARLDDACTPTPVGDDYVPIGVENLVAHRDIAALRQRLGEAVTPRRPDGAAPLPVLNRSPVPHAP